jgi:hypothetical protein
MMETIIRSENNAASKFASSRNDSCIFGRQKLRRAACAGAVSTMGGVTDAVCRQNI